LGLAVVPDCHPEGSEGSVILSEAKDQREILRFTQDDKAVLPVALWPTRAQARLRLMRIIADLSDSCLLRLQLVHIPLKWPLT
jgi:hypothetical protein